MTILFVGGWLLRSCLLILCGAALVKVQPVKTPAARLAAWTALLAASLAIPILNAVLPQIALAVTPAATPRRLVYEPAPLPAPLPIAEPVAAAPVVLSASPEASSIDWARLAVVVYFLTAGALLFRLFAGLLLSLGMYRRSLPTENGAEVRESGEIASPATIGVLRPVVLLPPDWRRWHAAKLAAVLAHEGSHIRRRDPAVQFVSAIHRALLWASPASWLLDRAIVRSAEQISDDDAIAATRDRVSYAETLLGFFQRAADPRHALVVPMARYDRPEKRIRRILRSPIMPGRLSRARIAAILLAAAPLAYFAAAAHPQGKDQPAFDIADVHVSPRSQWVKSQPNQLQGGYLTGDRYELRRATMLDLIRLAYNKDAARISGGPAWLDYDRFDIVARTKAGTPPETLRRMLQTLLQERFHLVVKEDTRPAPAFVLSRGKGELKMKAASPNTPSDCKFERVGTYGNTFRVECRNASMEQFADAIRPRLSLDPMGRLPVVDSTGLKGGWDFDLEIPIEFGATVALAVEKLGIKCEQGNAPQPVLVVENVSEQPTANSPDVAAKLPPQAPPAFEVASLKQTCAGGGGKPPWFEAGGRVTANCMPVGALIVWAWGLEQWGLTPSNLPFGLPEKVANQYISIIAQAPPGFAPNPNPQHNMEARDLVYAMLRTLLIERYRMKLHYEDRPVDTAALVAVKPKLAKADPSERTGCTRESAGEVMVQYACRNMTMAQFAEQLRGIDPTLRQVEDATGLKGAWDFTLNFDQLATMRRNFPRAGGGAAPDGQASEPSGALLLSQAIEKQLGLKLDTRKRPAPVLVIDHIEPNPTGN